MSPLIHLYTGSVKVTRGRIGSRSTQMEMQGLQQRTGRLPNPGVLHQPDKSSKAPRYHCRARAGAVMLMMQNAVKLDSPSFLMN